MPGWSFLTNHAVVLSYIAHYPRITALDLAQAAGITERAVRKIIADLLDAGYLTIKREGRRSHYHVNPDLPLRHAGYEEGAVGYLLEALGWKRRKRSPKPQ